MEGRREDIWAFGRRVKSKQQRLRSEHKRIGFVEECMGEGQQHLPLERSRHSCGEKAIGLQWSCM